eukprot:Em0054g8a
MVKRRFLADNPLWASLIDPPSVSSTASASSNSPLSNIPENSIQGSQQGDSGETPQSQDVELPEDHLSTPSPSLSDLLNRTQVPEDHQFPPTTGLSASSVVTTQHLPPTYNLRSRLNLEWADRSLQALRHPAMGGEEVETLSGVPTVTGAEEGQPTAGRSNPQSVEVLQTMELLVSSLSPSQREPMDSVSGTGGETPKSLNLEGVLDWNPILVSPQQCTEDRPPMPGWPYSPLSPTRVSWSPALSWPYSPCSSITSSTVTPNNSRGMEPQVRRPVGPGPGQEHAPVGNAGWMDSQGSGKGKSPIGKRGHNKGAGARVSMTQQGNQPTGRSRPVGGSDQPGAHGDGRGLDPGGRGNLGRERREVRSDRCFPRGNRGVAPSGWAQETPSRPVQPVREGPRVIREEERGGPRASAGGAVGSTIPRLRTPPLRMDKDDNQAPHKEFELIKPLTNRSLSTPEWSKWCLELEKWTIGLSQWAFERAKANSPQAAWYNRQSRRQPDGRQEEEGEGRRPQRPSQPGRNRLISRMANLQRLYNRAPRQCMDKELKLQRVDGGSSPGPDRIGYLTWKHLDADHTVVLSILNTCRINGKIPPDWKKSTTILIHKGDEPLVLDNWRPIVLQNTLYKKEERPIILTWLDLKDAYGSVPHQTLFYVLYHIANSTVKSLAYTDDLCVFASSPAIMQGVLDKVCVTCNWAGLTFSPKKCATLSIVRSQRARQRVATQEFHLGSVMIPAMKWEDRYKYLGVKTGANYTPDLEKLGEEYITDITAIMKSDLTDWQKLDAIHRFAKPRLIYTLQNQLPTVGWAKSLDKKMKTRVKSALKLPGRTNDDFLFSPWRAGGQGLPRIEDEVHIYEVSTAYRLLSLSGDPSVGDVAQAALGVTARKRSRGTMDPQDFLDNPPQRDEGKQGDIKSLWSRVRVSLQLCQSSINLANRQLVITDKPFGPAKRHQICKAMRAVLQGKHLDKWLSATDQGRAAGCISAHQASNHWIRGGKYTSFSEYRFAIKARLNLLPTRTVRKRSGEAIPDTSCPRCWQEQETLAHVLKHCPSNVGLGFQVLEQCVPGDEKSLKPDLVILNRDTSEAYVVDITVQFEGEAAFQEARKAKEDKYHHLKKVLHDKGYRKVEVDAFVVGALKTDEPRVPTREGSRLRSHSCSTHIREKHMTEACPQRAREAAQKEAQKGESTARMKWTQQETEAFKAALAKYGPSSNIRLAAEIGTRSAAQVNVHKCRFLKAYPNWLSENYHPAPPVNSAPTSRRSSESPRSPPTSPGVDSSLLPATSGTQAEGEVGTQQPMPTSTPATQEEGTPPPPSMPLSEGTVLRLQRADRALLLLRPNIIAQWEPDPLDNDIYHPVATQGS